MKALVVANWKMNPTNLAEAKRLFNSVKKGIKNVRNVEVVICPPFVYLPALKANGAQDCFWEEKGAFTGEVSPKMLKDLGVKYVIIGHSERRRNLNETDEMVNKKLKAALKVSLRPILCVSSKKRGEAARKEMEAQLKRALVGIKKPEIKNIVITYEPVWAISTTKGSIIATPKNTREGGIFIRNNLTKLFDKDTAKKVKIIYGGSVDSKSIQGSIKDAQMDGALVGAASLKAKEFIATVKKLE